MKTISVAITTTALVVPATTVAGPFRVTLSDAAGAAEVQTSADGSASFANVVAGDYTVLVERLDADGVVLGSASTSVSVADDVVTIDVPASVTASVA